MLTSAITFQGSQRLPGPPSEALARWSDFLRCCTNAGRPRRSTIELDPLDDESSSVAHDVLKELSDRYGAPAHRKDLDIRFWDLEPRDVAGAVQYAGSRKKWPIGRWNAGILHVSIRYQFQLLDPQSLQPLAGQSTASYGDFCADPRALLYLGDSRGRLTLGNTCGAGVWLSFPFENPEDGLTDFIDRVRKQTVWKFSRGSWRKWHLNKNRNGYVRRRLAVD